MWQERKSEGLETISKRGSAPCQLVWQEREFHKLGVKLLSPARKISRDVKYRKQYSVREKTALEGHLTLFFCNTPDGICDLAGNVWEWCAGAWDQKYYHRSPRENPSSPETGSSHVLRGGGWHNDARYCRSACRFFDGVGLRGAHVVFRLVRVCS